MVAATGRGGHGPEVPEGSHGGDAIKAVLEAIPLSKRKEYAYWLAEYRLDWRGEVPTKLHEPGSFGLGSAPPFTSAFNGYVGFIECSVPGCSHCKAHRDRLDRQKHFRKDDSRYRTSRAFRKLRRVAPREFDALYMYCMLGQDAIDIARSMNEEMVRKGRTERYSRDSVALLLYSGVDKVMGWW